MHDEASDIVPMLMVVRDGIYKAIAEKKNPGKCYIITTETDMDILKKWQEVLNADLHVVDTPKQECIERIMADNTRPNKERFILLVNKWFSNWEGGETDESGTES